MAATAAHPAHEGKRKVALITGITGQDGSYLAELLLSKGYIVHGIIRRASTFNTDRIDHIFQDPHEKDVRLVLHYGDLADAGSVNTIVRAVQPDEIYNLGAQSHVKVSFEIPEYTAQATGVGALHVLEAARKHSPHSKVYQASSSEMYGLAQEVPQSEKTPFYPRSPYGAAKVYAFWIGKNYREAYGMFVCNGILFNHESPRRGGTFVTRKITQAIARIKAGTQEKIYLGNLEAKRDWGYAPDYVEAMWRMLQHGQPDDYVVATGETHTVREFCEEAFRCAGMEIEWRGDGLHEQGVERASGKVRIEIDPRYLRPTEVDLLIGDARKAERELGWKPKVRFKELVRIMVESDIACLTDGTHYKYR